MKKTRIFAGLSALLCCTAVPLTVSAVTAQPVSTVWSEAYVSVKAGDLNLDDKLDITDVILLNKAILGRETLNTLQKIAADANKDGKITAQDSLAVMKAIVGILEKPSDIQLSSGSKNLSRAVMTQSVEGKALDDAFVQAQTDFYLKLFQNAEKETPDQNVLVSPYSVMQALAMTANGAAGETRSEMEQTLGGLPLNDLNEYLYTQRTGQPNDEKCSLQTYNSIWYRDTDRLHVLPDFLKINADYYSADAFKAPFDDSTVTDINRWVSNKTDRMIPEILDPNKPLSADDMMFLINAVTFDARWEEPYDSKYEVSEGEFTSIDGTVQKVQMMHSEEYSYLEDENAKGFYKYYSGRKYAFAAMLPNEGVSIDEYISGMTSEALHKSFDNHGHYVKTEAYLPKFSYEYDIKLNDALTDMGMPSAFKDADFSRMAETLGGESLKIDDVQHKTFISVTEEGTCAGAVTSVKQILESAVTAVIRLDRPFVFMIVDMENHLPVFIGAVKSIEE